MPSDMPRAQVLIVEDEADHAEVMSDALRKPGHVCTIVSGVREAIEELRGGMAPQMAIHCCDAQPWRSVPEGAPRFDRVPAGLQGFSKTKMPHVSSPLRPPSTQCVRPAFIRWR